MTQALREAFNPRHNSLNALRLLLATLVIVSHSWPIGGFGADPGFGDQNLGGWAVAGFFAASGYLITSSALASRSFMDYMWRRFLRIYPAFLVVLLVTAFIFSPISGLFDSSTLWTERSGFRYLTGNLALYITQNGIDGTLASVPFRYAWNGALWTLAYEAACYLVIGVAVSVIRNRRLLILAVGALFAASTLTTLAHVALGVEGDGAAVRFLRLSAFFAAGALVYLVRGHIPASPWIAAAAAALLICVAWLGLFQAFAGLPMAYLMMYFASVLPLKRIGAKNDISYGMYIYGFPIQQLLVLALPDHLTAAEFVILSVVLTIPFACASWFLIERPAMKLKRLTAARSPSSA